ncbi:MAG: hypothetical protein NVSMB57_00530 [Actinomycetota bacterium]
MKRRVPMMMLLILALQACGGQAVESFGSPRPVTVAAWKGYCAVHKELTKLLDRYFIQMALTKAEFINQASITQTATFDWADQATTDGANDIAAKMNAVALAIGHTKVAVDVRGDTGTPRKELQKAMDALPLCPEQRQEGNQPGVSGSGSGSGSTSPFPSAASSSFGSPGARDCTASDLNVEIRTNRSSYAMGQKVKLRVVSRNVSNTPCGIVSNLCTESVYVEDANGARVWESQAGRSCSGGSRMTFNPGKSHEVSYAWDQTKCITGSCDGSQVASGDYRAHASLPLAGKSGGGIGSATFTIRSRRSPTPRETPTDSPSRTASPSPSPSRSGLL